MLTVEQIAQQLNVSKMSVYRLIAGGLIPAFKVGRSVRVKVEEFDRYLEGVRMNGTARG